MDIGLLSVSMNVYSTKRIVEEAEFLGRYMQLIDHTKCSAKLGSGKPMVYNLNENVTDAFDAIFNVDMLQSHLSGPLNFKISIEIHISI